MIKKGHHAVVVAAHDIDLAKSFAKKQNLDFVGVEKDRFADTESIIRIEEPVLLKNRLVFLFYRFSCAHVSFAKGARINDQLLEFLLMAHQCKTYGAQKIVAVLPYLPYSRQSKDVTDQVAGPFEAAGLCFKAVGIDSVVSCELHETRVREQLPTSVFSLPVHQILFDTVWKTVLEDASIEHASMEQSCFLSPDSGGIERVRRVARLCGSDNIAHVEKKRVSHDVSIASKLVGDVAGKTVVLVDDIVDTAITAVNAVDIALEHGAKRVVACFCHPVLSAGAIERLESSALEKVWVCNTLDTGSPGTGKSSKISVVSVDQAIVSYLEKGFV